jgi:hypothetical protein
VSGQSERTALYRIRGEDDALLYIGISNCVPIRWNGHERVQPWWDELRSLTVEWCETREEAEAAEKAAIRAEQPKYNVTYLKSSGASRKRKHRKTVRSSEVELEPRPDDEDLLTSGEVADMTRTSEAVVSQFVNQGDLECFWLGKRRVFRKGKVRRWIAAIEASQQAPASGDARGAA